MDHQIFMKGQKWNQTKIKNINGLGEKGTAMAKIREEKAHRNGELF